MKIIFIILCYNVKNFDNKIFSKSSSISLFFSTKKVIIREIILNYYVKVEFNKLKFEFISANREPARNSDIFKKYAIRIMRL